MSFDDDPEDYDDDLLSAATSPQSLAEDQCFSLRDEISAPRGYETWVDLETILTDSHYYREGNWIRGKKCLRIFFPLMS